jgi:hypothetical protein
MSEEIWMPGDKTELLAGIAREWTALLNVIEKLDAAQMTSPDAGGWSPKDNLAHLSAWMRFMLDHHLGGKPAHEAMGIDAVTFERLDEDGVNAVIFERNRTRPDQDVLDELKRTYAEVVSALERISFNDLLHQRFPDDPEKRPVLVWVLGNTSEHFVEHHQAIEAAIKK